MAFMVVRRARRGDGAPVAEPFVIAVITVITVTEARMTRRTPLLSTPHAHRLSAGLLAAMVALFAISGCENADSPATDAGLPDTGATDAGATDAGAIDAGAIDAGAPVDFIALSAGAPETVLWDDARSLLYVVDNTGNRIWTWTDSTGLSSEALASLPAPVDAGALPANVTLGQAVLTAEGTLVVSRFGQPGGGLGGIAFVRPDGGTGLVPNLDPGRRRLGLAAASDGTLYGSYFASADGGTAGFLTTVDLSVGETVVADGFGKIVGLAINAGRLYVSDQSSAKVFDAPLAALPAHASDWHALATFVKPDQICAGPEGSLFSGQFQGAPGSSDPIAVRWISADGAVTAFKQDPDVSKPSGLSYDPTHRRLFVADSGNTARIGVHVFPVP